MVSKAKKASTSPTTSEAETIDEGRTLVVPKRSRSGASNITKSTAPSSGDEWSNKSFSTNASRSNRSVSTVSTISSRSISSRSMVSPRSTGSAGFLAPLNDLNGGSSHNRSSNRSMRSRGSFSNRSLSSRSLSNRSLSTRSLSNDSLEGESNHTVGESSLSSFLSVLLEDEEAKPNEISIVSDNAKPEQRSIRDLRLSFIQSAYENDKPKCRWEYLTRDNNDREKLARSRRRSKLETRSVSFSGPINETKPKLRFPNNNSAGSTKSKKNATFDTLPNKKKGTSKSKKNNTTEGMFLRMPVRKNSPMTAAIKKKSLMSRVNMSDTDLILLPMQPGSSAVSLTRRRVDGESGQQQQPLSRSGIHKESIGNAKWSKEDTMRERRRRNANEFLDFLLEPESDAARSGWPSPLPSPAVASPSQYALGISHRQLQTLALKSLDSSSSDDGDLKKKKKTSLETETTQPIPSPKQTLSKKQPRRSSGSSIKSGASASVKSSRSSKTTKSSKSKKVVLQKKQSRRSSGSSIVSGASSQLSNGSSVTKSSLTLKQPRRSSGSSISIGSSILSGGSGATKASTKSSSSSRKKDKKKCRSKFKSMSIDTEPPLVPTRFHNPYSPHPLSPKSPKELRRKKKMNFPPRSPKSPAFRPKASLSELLPLLSPKSPSIRSNGKMKVSLKARVSPPPVSSNSPSIRSDKKKVSLQARLSAQPAASPKSPSLRSGKKVSLKARLSAPPASPRSPSILSKVSLATFPLPMSPKSPSGRRKVTPTAEPPKGKWFSPFDYQG